MVNTKAYPASITSTVSNMYGESNNNLHHTYTYMFPLVLSALIVYFVNTVITDRIIYHFIKGYTDLFVSVKHRKIT